MRSSEPVRTNSATDEGVKGSTTADPQSARRLCPTLREAGIENADVPLGFATFAPWGTPREIIGKLNAKVVKISKTDDMKAKMRAISRRSRADARRARPTSSGDHAQSGGDQGRQCGVRVNRPAVQDHVATLADN